jgi:hypothetical protein
VDSRYVRILKTPLEKRKRVVKLHGAFEDQGKYFVCWVCGSINSVDRNVGYTGYGADPIDFNEAPNPPAADYNLPGHVSEDHMGLEEILPVLRQYTVTELGPDDSPVTTYYTPRTTNVSKGCWFCGTTNIFGGTS